MMTILNRSLLTFCLIVLSSQASFSNVDSVSVRIIEVANDSIGPWTFNIQEIDSIDNTGMISVKSKRKWDGTTWINDRKESFYFDTSGNLAEHVKYIWDGSTFIPQIKREVIYNSSGKLFSEISYQFNAGNWQASTKQEHIYTQQSNDSIVTSYTQISGNWIATDQQVFEYTINFMPKSEIRQSWNGAQWETVSKNAYSYNTAGLIKTTDSVFYYLSPNYLLSRVVNYFYTSSGKLSQKINRDFISYQYSDQDTDYIETEIDYEYTMVYTYNPFDLLSELHGSQTQGSSQAWAFENHYFQYNDHNLISSSFSHTGTNVTENFERQSSYYYNLLNANFSVSGSSCTGCPDGSVHASVNGGVAGYQVKITPDAGMISGTNIDYLPAGIYVVCVFDAIGNELCREINIAEFTTGINNIESNDTKISAKFINENSSLKIETNSLSPFAFKLFDQTGRLILQQNISSPTTIIPFKSCSSALYIFNATNSSINTRGNIISIR